MRREDLEPVILDQARGEIRDQYLDATQGRRSGLAWTARHSLDAGLARPSPGTGSSSKRANRPRRLR